MSEIRVLMVDDSEVDFDIVSRQLRQEDSSISVQWVPRADDCLRILGDGGIDLVLADYELSAGLDGLRLLKRIKEAGWRVPVIFMTGWGSEEVAAEAFRIGVVDYFVKDISSAHIARLANAIRNAVAQKRSRDEREKLQRQLEVSEKRYRALTESTFEAILGLDSTGTITFANSAIESILGISPQDAIGLDMAAVLARKGELDEALGSGPELDLLVGRTINVEVIASDGRLVPLEISFSSAEEASGFQYVVVMRDISERKRIESELEQKQMELIQAGKLATLGEMATGIAHELSQPLNTIKIVTQRLNKRLFTSKLDKKFFRDKLFLIREQLNRATLIIDHLRGFGRKDGVMTSAVELKDALDGVLTLLGEQVRLQGIELVADIPADLPPVRTELTRLEQVFINLMANARDALDAKEERLGGADDSYRKRLEIRARRPEGGFVVVEFSDNGCGMPAEVLDRIFEPFFTTKEVGSGTGLGLSISYGILRDMGGGIECSSVEMEGTIFRIKLPVADEAPSRERSTSR